MKQSIRHNKIIDFINQQGYISTEELVAKLNVSPQTIRRDLNELAENNLIRRHHGGAGIPTNSENSDYSDRKQLFSRQKNIIAQHIAKIIPNGASLFLDIGTTAEAVAQALLSHKDLRIVTNNLNAAHILLPKEDFQVTIAGGNLRQDGGIIGSATIDIISQFRLDFGILGISAIDDEGSMLDYDYHEVKVKRALMNSSRQVILAADHSKFYRKAIVRLGDLREINHLFTDAQLPTEIEQHLNNRSVQVHLCYE
ncbi:MULTISPECIES: DeoR/GlpR family transcriptional regulator [Pasteurellaceae]|uniref:DeoR/GlpR family transcriptional regulator n=1 Tax=Pasteurella atlantica TaxID=2827233 RepID=A0AAW8CQU5_9PAST|nr:DeoR/GlpR family transcriptional regulator [Pasteurella atlantica]MBR0573909.1 DeoR/GlpR family transcriptional regulator [Pasteurella atlantica]MDP8039856.1 DeoR/GlpR family transcriptional regulator [Pasteurella atlantica]MDP8041984.1 DeoR/GlpR family transcriptional regulator [Pasteurella atlantica]MDP8044133.1 DeoR/GlpR family transcriptional regulator [Pasteurella atlantica]MDP8046183.1 DeoR/GlpR family transcriptional regulator [Pasteurella atlantica]